MIRRVTELPVRERIDPRLHGEGRRQVVDSDFELARFGPILRSGNAEICRVENEAERLFLSDIQFSAVVAPEPPHRRDAGAVPIADEQIGRHFSVPFPDISYVDTDLESLLWSDLFGREPEVGILKVGVTQAVAERKERIVRRRMLVFADRPRMRKVIEPLTLEYNKSPTN